MSSKSTAQALRKRLRNGNSHQHVHGFSCVPNHLESTVGTSRPMGRMDKLRGRGGPKAPEVPCELGVGRRLESSPRVILTPPSLSVA